MRCQQGVDTYGIRLDLRLDEFLLHWKPVGKSSKAMSLFISVLIYYLNIAFVKTYLRREISFISRCSVLFNFRKLDYLVSYSVAESFRNSIKVDISVK